jgi:serine/threonine protein kinase/tetratricopeptide (TPR) repeat protein
MIGRIISHYRILEKIGEGGMGVIYKAEDTSLKRIVALKFLPPHALKSQKDRERFVREAQAAGSFDHPNICTIHEIDEVDGQTFIAMAYVEGHDLAKKIQRGPLKLDDAVNTAIQVAEGLSEAHARSIIHRDIKSTNVIITPKGIAKVMDFGIAKLPEKTRLTRADGAIGTIAYMSPEQARGGNADRRSDIWSLGVLLYEMIAGSLPFESEHEQAMTYLIMNEDPQPLTGVRTGVPLELERIVKKAMAKSSGERYQHLADMIVDLKAVSRKIAGDTAAAPRRSRRSRPGVKVLVPIGVLLVLLVFFGKQYFSPSSSMAINSIAVLPLDNLSTDPEQEFFADGMTDALILGLAQIGTLRVISRTSAMHYKDSRKTLPQIAQELDVDAILEGSVMRSGDRVQITAQLIYASTDEHLWADKYESDLGDVLKLQADVARSIANRIALTLTPEEQTRLSGARSVAPAALEAYMRGRFHWNKRTPRDIVKGLEHFESAVAIEPDFALAYVGIAESYNLCVSYQIMPVQEAVPKAKQAAQRALQLDGSLGEAHSAIASISDKECKFADVIDDYIRATDMSPNYGTARQWYAEALSRLGRHDEAIVQIQKARALDPLSLPTNTVVGVVHYNNRQYDAALDATRQVLELDPSFPPAVGLTAKIYDMKHMHDEAMTYYERYMELAGIDTQHVREFAEAFEQGGMEVARRWYTRNFRESAVGALTLGYSLALFHAMLGENERALEWLEKLSDGHCWNVADLKVEPMFDGLRGDPRYTRLVKKVGLE